MGFRLFLMILVSVFLAIWVWKTKHRSRSLLKTYASFIAILYGIPFVASILLASLVDFSTSTLGLGFQLDAQTSGGWAKTSVTFMAVLVSLPAAYKARKTIRTPLLTHPRPQRIG